MLHGGGGGGKCLPVLVEMLRVKKFLNCQNHSFKTEELSQVHFKYSYVA